MGRGRAIDTSATALVETLLDATGGRGADIVIEAAGFAETVNAAIRMARRGGTVALIGLLSELNPQIAIHAAMAKELKVQTVRRSNHCGQEALDLVASGRIPSALITHSLHLEETAKAFEMLSNYCCDGVGKA